MPPYHCQGNGLLSAAIPLRTRDLSCLHLGGGIVNHYVTGGQADALASTLARLGFAGLRLTRLGVERVPECGTNDEVLRAHELDAASLARRIRRKLEGS